MRTTLLIALTLSVLVVACAPVQRSFTIDSRMTMGAEDAPVTLYEFSDYECPFCKKFTTESLPNIIKDYVKDGTVRFVYKDYPLGIHANAIPAAAAARCAGRQGKYFAYHDILFIHSREINDENILVWADDLELDLVAFESCLGDPDVRAAIERDWREGNEAGAVGTPTIFINNRKVVGAQPYSVYKNVIEEELGHIAKEGSRSCTTDAICGEQRILGPYCSNSNPDEVCTTTMTPTCMTECTILIVEECQSCPSGCADGACAAETLKVSTSSQ